jgi:hypothetical protein
MKKNKIWSFILVLLATMIIACSGDDNNNSSSSNGGNIKAQLIGIWKTSMSDNNLRYIKLEANGKLLFSVSATGLKEIINNTSSNSNKAFWSYNESENTISMYTGGSYSYTCKVNMAADGKSWTGYDISNSSKTYTFIKVNNLDDVDEAFPDYQEGTLAYFAYQFPVRTLILGNDIYDNSLANEHKCQIWATMGGAYVGRNATVDFIVDESLCDNLYFLDANGNVAEPVRPLPTDCYKLLASKIDYNGDQRGYVEVQFTDEFFKKEHAIDNYYVIPW